MAAHFHGPDEGLPEVVTDPSPQALTEQEQQYLYHQQQQQDKYHVVYDDAPKFPDETNLAMIRSPDDSVRGDALHAGDGAASGHENISEKAEGEPRICGLRRKLFFLLLIAALVVAAAAIGGGVGGGVAAARSRQASGSAASNSSASSSSSSSSSSSTASVPSSETSITPTSTPPGGSTTTTGAASSPTPTFLNNQTAGFGFQGFSAANFSGNVTQIYRDEGFFDLEFEVWSYVWMPNGTSCCVTFCADQHNATGYRCEFRKREMASGPVPRIYIWCDPHLAGKANGTCS